MFSVCDLVDSRQLGEEPDLCLLTSGLTCDLFYVKELQMNANSRQFVLAIHFPFEPKADFKSGLLEGGLKVAGTLQPLSNRTVDFYWLEAVIAAACNHELRLACVELDHIGFFFYSLAIISTQAGKPYSRLEWSKYANVAGLAGATYCHSHSE